ncbi:MAG: hypothetical protein LQ351_003455 [Letrouitia transgressa]|nr:MAG: hypothetical protein LQ351_003455 [Letrouitia transgressa]
MLLISELPPSANAAGDTADKVREWSSLIGITTAIVGNILISFALNIQRYAHIRLSQEKEAQEQNRRHENRSYGTEQSDIAEERAKLNLKAAPMDYHINDRNFQDGSSARRLSIRSESPSESTTKPSKEHRDYVSKRTYLSSPYWWAGIVLMIIGEAGNFLAYGFAPASIVSPLGVVALVSNCIIAPCLLKEPFRQRDLWGVLVAIAGAVTVVLSAKVSETIMRPEDIWSAITRWEFELYLGITALVIIVLLWASGKYGHKSILIDLGLVALFGGYTALSTKGVASLLSDALWRALKFPILYLLIAVLAISAVLQIRYINRALQHFDSTQVIPTQFVLFTISVIIGSAILYRDFESATADRVGKFIGGCLLTFAGVYLLTSGREEAEHHEAEFLEDEEEGIGLIDEEQRQQPPDSPSKARGQSSLSIAKPSSQPSSRRSSQEPRLSLPQTPQRSQSNSSSTTPPAATLFRTFTTPATSADLLTDPRTPLLENPWSTSSQDYYTPPTRPPINRLSNTVSTPLLPSSARNSSPSPTTPQSPSHRPSLPRTPISRLHLTPGPYISPLSSSALSAIVADSRRRSMHNGTPTRRRPRLDVLRDARSQREGEQEEAVEDEAEGEVWSKGRAQSVGGALGEFLRTKFRRERDRGRDRNGEGSEERDDGEV